MKKILLILPLLLYWSCEDVSPTAVDLTFKVIEKNIIPEWTQNDDDIKIGGEVITFDDRSISKWFSADSLLSKYGWKATFCVSRINRLTAEEIQILRILQNKGHEISGHGLNHYNAVKYVSKNGLDSYLNQEIIPMIEIMQNESLIVNSFAYPYGSRNSEIDDALFDYFQILRGTTYDNILPLNHNCFFNNSTLVYGIGIDSSYEHFSDNYILKLMDYAKTKNKILILYAHEPVDIITSNSQTKFSTLELICDNIRENNMNFYTLSDLIPLLR